MDAVVGGEEKGAADRGELSRDAAGAAWKDVGDGSGPRDCAVGSPQLPAAVAIIGLEEQDIANRSEVPRHGTDGAWVDVSEAAGTGHRVRLRGSD